MNQCFVVQVKKKKRNAKIGYARDDDEDEFNQNDVDDKTEVLTQADVESVANDTKVIELPQADNTIESKIVTPAVTLDYSPSPKVELNAIKKETEVVEDTKLKL